MEPDLQLDCINLYIIILIYTWGVEGDEEVPGIGEG